MEVPAPLDAPLDAPPQDGYIEPLPTLSDDEDDDEDDAEIEAPVVRIREGYEATVSAETAAASVPAAPASCGGGAGVAVSTSLKELELPRDPILHDRELCRARPLRA